MEWWQWVYWVFVGVFFWVAVGSIVRPLRPPLSTALETIAKGNVWRYQLYWLGAKLWWHRPGDSVLMIEWLLEKCRLNR